MKIPNAFWKVIIRGSGPDERAIAWIVPNSKDATKKNLDRYLISIDDLERVLGEKIPVADYAKHDKPSLSWLIPKGCNKGGLKSNGTKTYVSVYVKAHFN